MPYIEAYAKPFPLKIDDLGNRRSERVEQDQAGEFCITLIGLLKRQIELRSLRQMMINSAHRVAT